MQKIIDGVRRFRQCDFQEQKEYFEHLAEKQQRPLALLITCADSRILPSRITGTEPGDLFLIRNAGNLVPPYGGDMGGEIATIEYALAVLQIKNIIICGHSQCGAVEAILKNSLPDDMPGVKAWFKHAEAMRQIVQHKHANLIGSELRAAACEENVLVQMNNLSTHPKVAAGLAMESLHVYGWYYDIGTGTILQYDQSRGAFLELGQDALATCPILVRAEVA